MVGQSRQYQKGNGVAPMALSGVWGCGDVGMWGCGDMRMWGHGDVGAGMAPPALTLLLPMAAQSPFPPPFFLLFFLLHLNMEVLPRVTKNNNMW